MRKYLLLVTVLMYLMYSANADNAGPSLPSTSPTNEWNEGGRPFKHTKQDAAPLINPNGTLNLNRGISGSLELQGSQVNLDPVSGPVLIPSTLTFTPDPGQCVSPMDTFVTGIPYAPPPCPSAGDDVFLQMCSQEFVNVFLWTYIPNSTPGGHWLPPLDPPYTAGLDLCYQGEGTYYYVVSEPGCPDDTAVVTVDLTTWDPCGWYELIYGECVGIGDPGNCCDDTILVTVPPIPGYHDGTSFSLTVFPGTVISGVGNYDDTSTFLITLDSIWPFCPEINIVDDGTQCQAFFFLQDYCIPVIPCSCSNPPNAGEDTLILVCSDVPPFDLTTALGGAPDPGGNWSPPLNSGNNIYDPIVDGTGTYIYTVSSPGCNDDQAVITINVQINLPATISGVPSSMCETEAPIVLSTVQNGITGIWSGEGVNNNSFDPSGLNGDIIITFTPEPGQCVSPVDIIIIVTDCSPPPCQGAGDDGSGLICPIDYKGLLGLNTFIDNFNWQGMWLPPLPPEPYGYYIACEIGPGEFHYVVSEPGCPDDTATVTIQWPLDPCGWPELIYIECVSGGDPNNPSDDTLLLTIPPLPGFHIGQTYSIMTYLATIIPGAGYYDSTSTFIIVPDSCSTTCSFELFIIDDESQCPVNFWGLLMVVESCICTNAPYAGENNAITLCSDNPPFDLTTEIVGDPDPGGTWIPVLASGGNIYDPLLDGSGAFTYTVSSTNCPDDEAVVNVNVLQILPAVISGVPSSLCETNAPIPLSTVQNGISGTWSGNGVSNNTFNPAGLNGNILLTFTPDAGQCASTATTNIHVSPVVIPLISGIPSILCVSSPPLSLPVTQNGIVGNWSGQNVLSNIFDPSGLSGIFILSFIPDTGQCATTATMDITIQTSFTPGISGIPSTLCEADPAILLPEIQEGVSGNWSGPGVINNEFNPSGLSGAIMLDFTPDTGLCANPTSTEISIELAILPVITGVPNQLCESSGLIQLPILQDGITGTWSGVGVSNNIFSPAGLNGNIVLSFTPDPGQCAYSAMTIINIQELMVPAIEGVPVSLCESADSIFLPVVQNNVTGSWSGQNINNNFFNPAGLTGMIQLSFMPDTGQCAATANTTIQINEPPSFQNLMASCDSLSQNYVVSFDISGGMSGTYTVDDALVIGSAFVSMPIDGDSVQYSFELDDVNGCGPVIIDGSKNCACATYSGTMSFINVPIKVCIGSSFNVLHHNDQHLDPDDILAFVLHDNSGTALGSIFAIYDTTTCTIPAGIVLGQTYFLSAIAGSNGGTGSIDLADACLSVSQGVPVIFYSLDASISPGGSICQSDCFTYQVLLTGQEPFSLQYNVLVNGQSFSTMLMSDTDVVNIILCPSEYGITNGSMDVLLMNLTDANCSVSFSPTVGTEFLIHQEDTIDYNPVLCDGESMVINNTLYNQSHSDGIEIFAGGNMFGCDSILNVSLLFNNPVVTNVNETLCIGSSLLVNGTAYDSQNPSGTEVIKHGAANGCDSTVNVNLEFDSIVTTYFSMTLCPGESIVINGVTYDESHSSGSEFIQDPFGCDSMVNVDLIFYSPGSFEIRDTLCEGDSLVIHGHVYHVQHQMGSVIIPDEHGCDSTIHVRLTFYEEEVFILEDTLNSGDSLVINETTYNQMNPSGMEIIKGGSVNGCDSTIHVALYFRTVLLTASVQYTSPPCHGDSTGEIVIESVGGGFDVIHVSLNGDGPDIIDTFPYSIVGLSAGFYTIWIQDTGAIADPYVMDIELLQSEPITVDAGPDRQIEEEEDTQLNGSSTSPVVSWSWTPDDFLSCTDCPGPAVMHPEFDVLYQLEVSDAYGCRATDDVQVVVSKSDDIYIPNIFSPNGDGINDELKVSVGPAIVQVVSFEIFDRWGNLIFRNDEHPIDPSALSWDGKSRGKETGPGVYVCQLKAVDENGKVIHRSGDITMVR